MKKTMLFLLLGTLALFMQGQNSKADSLTALLKTARDTDRVNVLNELCKNIWYNKLDEAKRLNQEALALATNLSYQKGLAEAFRCRGVLFSPVFRNDSTGMPYSLKALELFHQLNDKKGLAATLNNLSRFYLQQRQYGKALDALQQALALFTELKDKEAVGAVTNQLGNVYSSQADYPNAINNYLKALAIRKEIGDKPGTSFSLSRVGDMYFQLQRLPDALGYYQEAYKVAKETGRQQNISGAATGIGAVYQKQEKYADALVYYKIAVAAAEAFFGKDSVAGPYQRIGEAYQAQKRPGQALAYFQKALQVANRSDQSEIAGILLHIGQVYLLQKNHSKAEKNLVSSLQLAKQKRLNGVVRDASLHLSQLWEAEGDYRKAYDYHLQYSTASDLVLNEDLNQKLAALQQSLELKNKQTQIDLLTKDKQLQQSEINRQKQQRTAFIVGFGLVLILLFVLVRSIRQKQKTNRLLNQKSVQVEEKNGQLQQAYTQVALQKDEILEQRNNLEKTLNELKAMQTQLIQREKMASLGELTAGIAHEIQNPLNFVNNFSGINTELLEELSQANNQRNQGEVESIAITLKENELKISHHGRRADAIVKSMLQHSKGITGERQPTDINQLIEEHLRLAYHGYRAKDKFFAADVTTAYDQSISMVSVVPQEIGRVFLNLFTNAFYAVTEKSKQLNGTFEPTVSISTKREGNTVVIVVKDNGTGMPSGVADKVFQPFFTTKPAGEGTGLGLSLSYDIITKGHGGELTVETKEGEFAEFIVRLPVKNN